MVGPDEVPSVLPAPGTVVVIIGGPLAPEAVADVCARVRGLVEAYGVDVLTCDVGGLRAPDVRTVDTLARLALTARRLGCSTRLRHAGDDLRALLDLTGLGRVFGYPPAAGDGECPDGGEGDAAGAADGPDDDGGIHRPSNSTASP